jgi:putative transposase
VLRVRVFKDGPQPLAVREWTWGNCDTVLDRDVNAAVDIKTEGRAVAARRVETVNACGG